MVWRIQGGRSLRGAPRLPGDKSITHRALILGALASGETTIRNGGWGADCRSTAGCLRALGCAIRGEGTALATVAGCGGVFRDGTRLDCGNSGTTMRLLAGALAGRGISVQLDGDASLRRRPMGRVAEPLRAMGATVGLAEGDRPPLAILPPAVADGRLRGIEWRTLVASAQVKSAILLAGLAAAGPTTVIEPTLSRDHTERMLTAFGASVERIAATQVTVRPGELTACTIDVPRDFSAAAYWLGAGLLCPDGLINLQDVGVNPTRTGLLTALAAFGADIAVSRERLTAGGEPVADLAVAGRQVLHGATINGSIVPLIIDELPLLATLATQAEGETRVSDAGELRVKECDRIAAMASGLRAFGADIAELPDGWLIHGPTRLRPARVDVGIDHRVAMALAVAAVLADGASELTGLECATVSDEHFVDNLASLGALVR